MKEKKTKSSLKTALKIVILIIVVAAVAFIAGKAGNGMVKEKTEINTIVLENKLIDIAELATLDYHYKDLAEYNDKKDIKGITIPFTTTHFFVTFEGDIKMGIDVSDIDIKETPAGFVVTVPEAKILSHEIDSDSIEAFDEKYSTFNKTTVTDYNEFVATQQDRIEKEVLEKDCVKKAHDNAVKLVQNMLSEFESDEVKIEVK